MLNLKNIYGAEFGKINDKFGLRLTANGLGVRGADGQITVLDKATKTLTTVPDALSIGDLPIYAFPADKLAAGDLIVHAGNVKAITEVDETGGVVAINFKTQTEEIILVPKTFFGFKGVAKIVSLFEGGFTGGAEGGMNPMMLMLLSDEGDLFGDEDGDGDGIMKMMLMSQMFGGKSDLFGGDMAKNPLMMLMLMKNL